MKDYCDMPELEGSYLIFPDFSKSIKEANVAEVLEKECNILVNSGVSFSKDYGSYVRVNLATSLVNIKEAVTRIKAYIDERRA